jgi:hypothetical protein
LRGAKIAANPGLRDLREEKHLKEMTGVTVMMSSNVVG